MSNSPTPIPPPPQVGAANVEVSVDPTTGVGTLTGAFVFLDGSTPPAPHTTLRRDQLAYGAAEMPTLLSRLTTAITANGGTATPAHLALVVLFVDALRATPPPPQTPAQPTTYTAPNLLT